MARKSFRRVLLEPLADAREVFERGRIAEGGRLEARAFQPPQHRPAGDRRASHSVYEQRLHVSDAV